MRFSTTLFSMGLLLANACSSSSDDGEGGEGGNPSSGPSMTSAAGGDGGTGGANTKETVEVSGDISQSTTWSADKNYLMKGIIRVKSGATLTIEKGTTIFGDKTSLGTLVVQQGGKLVAKATADEPIVFTSALPSGERAPGDWGGVVILGKAPINEPGGTASVEGFTMDETFGGTDAMDSSGELSYVRIEFSGIEIAPDNEVNGLTLAGVGKGTKVDHILVQSTLDDCFEFFGGTVDASHLVCYRNGDDGFDFDSGYVGRLQFLFLQQDPSIADEANGLECDNDKDAPTSAPITNPTIYNLTLCGQKSNPAKQQYGFLFRRGFHATIRNAAVSGFEAGVDIRDRPSTDVTLEHSIFIGNVVENLAYAEDGTNEEEQKNDDAAFDERAWFTEGTGNATTGIDLAKCFDESPDPRPAAKVAGMAPPNDGFFDASADFVGAFKDATDTWMTGNWVRFASE